MYERLSDGRLGANRCHPESMSVRGRVSVAVLASLLVLAALFFFLVPTQRVSTQCQSGPNYQLCEIRDVTAFQLITHSY